MSAPSLFSVMKSPRTWISAAVMAGVLLALALVSGRVREFLSGEDFQKLVERHAGAALGGDAELTPLRWTGPSAFSDTLRVRGGSGSSFQEIEARHLRADWNWRAIFSGAWRLEEITVESLRGTFGPPSGTGSGLADPLPFPAPSGWISFLPKRFELGQALIRRADLSFGDISLRDSALKIQPDRGDWKFSGTGGTLAIPHWPSLSVESYQSRSGGDRLRIDAASLRVSATGRIAVSGDWPGKLDLEWDGVELSDLLQPPWKGMVNGTVSGNGKIEAAGSAGSFQISNAVLRGAEWLEELAILTGRGDFRRLSIQKATGDFEFREGVWRWNDLVLESEGLLRIEGRVSVSADRSLSGEVRVGVASALLRSLPGAREKVFTETRDGFVWTPVRLGGTLESPSEDLSARLAMAAGETVLEAVQPVLQAVPAGAGDAVGETINTLFDILGR